MHKKILLAVQVIFFVSSSAWASIHSSLMFERGTPSETTQIQAALFVPVNDQQLREYVKQNITQIESIVKSNKTTAEKLSFIQDRVSRVSEFRAKHWSKSAFTEYELDMTIKPFESFPAAQNFKADRCDQYQSHLINEWEPMAPDMKPANRGVANALNLLKKICS